MGDEQFGGEGEEWFVGADGETIAQVGVVPHFAPAGGGRGEGGCDLVVLLGVGGGGGGVGDQYGGDAGVEAGVERGGGPWLGAREGGEETACGGGDGGEGPEGRAGGGDVRVEG